MSDGQFAFGLPDEGVEWIALVLGALAALLWPRMWRRFRGTSRSIAAAAFVAALLSTLYIFLYLRAGPRIIDATAYWLQARALAAGWLAWPLTEPEHAVLGRFLLRTPHAWGLLTGPDAAAGVAVIFPPGYPALLALAMRLGAPLAVGPAVGFALVVATAALARQVRRSATTAKVPLSAHGDRGEHLVWLAAVMSALCMALRYHTADTMSHGLAALCFVTALSAALALAQPPVSTRGSSGPADRPRSRGPTIRHTVGYAALCGLAAGWLFATRPASGLALLLVLVVLLGHATRRGQLAGRWAWTLAAFSIAALPGIGLWLLHQHAATGSLSTTAQAAYYATSDGPPGCFTYGFGPHIGCRGEHGTFVHHRLAHGYGAIEALGTTLRRLEMHVSDVLNFAPLCGLVPVGLWLGRGIPAVRVVGLAVAAQMLCYAPFYFDGNYPGGGARMFADVLPLEHVLCATALCRLAARAPTGHPSLGQLAGATVGLMLIGFAVQTGNAHAQLRDREGGRPMFEPSVLTTAVPGPILLFFGTDHGFNLAYQPEGSFPRVARYHGDDLDRLVWESRGRPTSYRYQYDPSRPGSSGSLEPLPFSTKPTAERGLRIEAESLWPPEAQHGGWAWPRHSTDACAYNGRWLVFEPWSGARAGRAPRLSLRLPAKGVAGRTLQPRVHVPVAAHDDAQSIDLRLLADDVEVHAWSVRADARRPCRVLEPAFVPPETRVARLVLSSETTVSLDRFDLQPRSSSSHAGAPAGRAAPPAASSP